jgi:hypothetical protein
MHKFFATIFVSAIMIFGATSCTKQDYTDCNSPTFNASFKNINRNSTYAQVKALFGTDGDNYKTVVEGTKKTKYYRWYPCSDRAYYVECRFENDVLVLSQKSIKQVDCSDLVDAATFATIDSNMSYSQIKAIMGAEADNYRNIYQPNDTFKFYRFYSCADSRRYFEIMFKNDKATVFTKNFVY